MDFIDLQDEVFDAIAAHATFAPNAATTVCKDLGDKTSFIQAALDFSNNGQGYAVSIWPPAKGHSDSEEGGASAVHSLIVVRFEANPEMLATLADASEWINTRVKDIISAILSLPQELDGSRFQLAQDAFELVNFDQGLIAYHIRFARLAVFGINT